MQASLLAWVFFCWGGSLSLPYEDAGLSKQEAAAHLLNRMTFGPRPGQVQEVLDMGLEAWFLTQLEGSSAETALDPRLNRFPVLGMSNQEILALYPPRVRLLKMAEKDGVLTGDMKDLKGSKEARQNLRRYAAEQGARPIRELQSQLLGQKLTRAIYSENQVNEVMTDFWFNHFTVSWVNNRARHFILSYERDAVRPNALGNFRRMLGDVARHPAMLLYLDNAGSTAAPGAKTTMEAHLGRRGFSRNKRPARARNQKKRGTNENYARELMELHTLGVDGGYSQDDVVEVARAFTGWTVWPMGPWSESMQYRLDRGRAVGFERKGDFLFRADFHDAGPKTILGVRFPKGGGVEEGDKVLDMLTKHPSTARFISLKLARRFVADQPPESLVDAMTNAFSASGGDVKTVLKVMVSSKAFWSEAARNEKVKTPLELAVSGVRALDAGYFGGGDLALWIEKMGQPLYQSPAPNGFSDQGSAWVNGAALTLRLDFMQKLASHRISGVYPKRDITGITDRRQLTAWTEAVFPPAGLAQAQSVLQKQAPNVPGLFATTGFQQK